MPKRKLSDLTDNNVSTDKSDARSLHIQTVRLKQKFSQGVESLAKALKLARGFERQKWKRREKKVKEEGKEGAVERMAEEAGILRVCTIPAAAVFPGLHARRGILVFVVDTLSAIVFCCFVCDANVETFLHIGPGPR